MKKILAFFGILTIAVGGVTLNPDQSFRLEAQANAGGQFDFGPVPAYTVDVSENGIISVATEGRSFTMEPEGAGETGKKGGKSILIDAKQDGENIKMDRVWGLGSTIEVIATDKKLTKQVKLEEGFIGTLSKDGEYYEVSFTLGGDFIVADGEYTGRVEIAPNVWLEKGLAWDSSGGDPNQNYTDVAFIISGGILTKKIPVTWLKTATYPIYTDAIFTFGSKQSFDTGVVGTVDVLPIGTNKYATCWTDNADTTQEGQCIVATVSGTVSTFGSVSDFDDDLSGANNAAMGACSAGDDRWVVVYNEDLAGDVGKVRVASSTGTTINGYGTATTFRSATTTFPACAYVGTDKIVIGFGDNPGSGTRTMEVIACTINANYTLTCGSAVPLEVFTTSSVGGIGCTTLNTNKFGCFYISGVTGAPSRIGAGTVSGTTITLGATTTISGVFSSSLGHAITSPDADKFIVHWTENSSIRQGLVLGTISGTTITLGATTTAIISTTTSFSFVSPIDASSAFLMYQQGVTDATSTYLAAIPIGLNFTTRTFSTSSAEIIDTTTDPGSLHAVEISENKFAFVWEDDNDTNDLFAKIGDILTAPVEAFINGNALINGNLFIAN